MHSHPEYGIVMVFELLLAEIFVFQQPFDGMKPYGEGKLFIKAFAVTNESAF